MIRLTVFADHDLQHSLAGGANVNLEENLKRFSDQITVKVLCSWEPGLKEKETIRNIEYIRFKGNLLTLRFKIYSYFKKHLETTTDIVWDEIDFSVPWMTPLYTKKPILLHCLHVQKRNFFHELPWWKATPAYIIEPFLYKFYRKSKVLTISQSTKDSLLDMGFDRENISIVSPGLNAENFGDKEQLLKNKSKELSIVSLARLRAWKGVHYSIAAMKIVTKKLPNAILYVVGTGPYENELKKLTSKLKLENSVRFKGRVSEKDKMDLLKKAHLLTKTSCREGWGIDVLEANCCMTPAVGWDVPGTKDSIQNGKTGLLVPFEQVHELAEAIIRILENPSLRKNFAENAYHYSSQFTWVKSAQSIETLLNEMVQQKTDD